MKTEDVEKHAGGRSGLSGGLDAGFKLPDDPYVALAMIGELLDSVKAERIDCNDKEGRMVTFPQLHALQGLAYEARRISSLKRASIFDIVIAFIVRAFLPHKIKTPENARLSSTEALSGVPAFTTGSDKTIRAGTVVIGKRGARHVAFNSCHNVPPSKDASNVK